MSGRDNVSTSAHDRLGIPALHFDYTHYVPDLEKVLVPWTEDKAFWPTSLIYGLAFVVGVVGNILVVFALTGDKKARNATSAFLVSLAVADLLFLLICVPYETASKLISYWAGGLALCKISGYVEMLTAAASILNLTAVSVERYVVIVHPMKTRSWFTMSNTVSIIVAVWVIAILLCSPVLYIMETTTTLFYNNSTWEVKLECMEMNFKSSTERILFAWYHFLVMFIIPLIGMGYCYTVVIRVLWLSTQQLAKLTHSTSEDESRRLTTNLLPPPSNSSSPSLVATFTSHGTRNVIRTAIRDQGSEIREARKQVIRMLMTIIAVFLLCWGPKLVLDVMKRHELAVLHSNRAFEVGLALNLLPYIQSAMNPLIYCFMSKNFRRSLRIATWLHCHCDPSRVLRRRTTHVEFDLETRSVINGTVTSKYWPSRYGRSSTLSMASDV